MYIHTEQVIVKSIEDFWFTVVKLPTGVKDLSKNLYLRE